MSNISMGGGKVEAAGFTKPDILGAIFKKYDFLER